LNKGYTLIKDQYGTEVQLDSDAPQIINRDAYRMFVSKLIIFNNKYAEKDVDNPELYDHQRQYLKNRVFNTKHPFDIEIFYKMSHRWRSIAKLYYATKDDPTGLNNIRQESIHGFPRERLELLKDSAREIYYELSTIATTWRLGKPYTDKYNNEKMDYTDIAHDILELSLLATHAYTDIFDVLDKEHGGVGMDKMRDLARVMHSSSYDGGEELPTRSRIDYASESLIRNPNYGLKTFFTGYTEETYLSRVFEKDKKDESNKPEKNKKENKKENEKLRKQREKAVNDRKEAERLAEEKRKAEDLKLEAEQIAIREAQEAQERLDNLRKDNENKKQAFPIVPDDENPSKINQAFYAYFAKFAERMGISPEKLNAQSIIQEASIAYLTEDSRRYVDERDSVNNEPLLKSLVPMYEQIQRITYESYIEKCLEENRPIDLEVPSNEALDLMSVAMYTMYPTTVNGEIKDIPTLAAIRQVVNGNYTGKTMINKNIASRADMMELAKATYLEKDDSFFTEDAEARFEAFTTDKKSSSNIIAETAAIVNLYNEYKQDRADPAKATASHTAHQEAIIKKEAMDAAYALEKRIETRYNTRSSRFFRYISYSNQKEELARIKGILGIPANERVAAHIKESRINDLFPKIKERDAKAIAKQRYELVGNYPGKYITQLLEKHLGKDGFPKITKEDLKEEYYQRVVRYDNLTPASKEAARLLEQKRMEEELEKERIREKLEKERLKQEKIEEEKRREEERILKEKEEEKRRIEEEERKIKEAKEAELRRIREKLLKEKEERKRKEEEDHKKWAEEKRIFVKDYREKEAKEYDSMLKDIIEFKAYADKDFEEKSKIEAEKHKNLQDKIDTLTSQLQKMEDELVIAHEMSDNNSVSQTRLLSELANELDAKRNALRESKDFKDLKKAADAEEKKNKKNPAQKSTAAKDALTQAIEDNTEVTALRLKLQTIHKSIADQQVDFAMKETAISDLKKEKEALEKDLNRINHDYEIARAEKEYAEKSLKYFEDNKDEIIKRGGVEKFGNEIFRNSPAECDHYKCVQPQPLYEKNVSELEFQMDVLKEYRDL
jgi:hypothetical protein